MAIMLCIVTFFSTFLGGLFALRFKDELHRIMAFCAGTVIGAALFELLPEAIETGSSSFSIKTLSSVAVVGFMAYMILDKMALLHSKPGRESSGNTYRGRLGAGTFSIHSFFDGLAIGFGFQVSMALGIIIAIAVITHDFSDGINTVTVILKEKIPRKEALKWLLIDATTPLLGAASTLFIRFPASLIGLILAVFSGCFLYIGAGDLLPESQYGHDKKWATLLTIAGATLLYLTIKILE